MKLFISCKKFFEKQNVIFIVKNMKSF